MIKPAIVVVGYNRLNSLERLLESLSKAYYPVNNVTLIISLDYHKKLQKEILEMLDKFEWKHGEKKIICYKEKQGLKQHILRCGDLSEKYEAVLILEDDLYVAPDFYNFLYQAVNYYYKNDNIVGVALYSHEWNGYSNVPFIKRKGESSVFAGQFSISWGQCWIKKNWRKFRQWYEINKEYEYNFYIPERINRWSKQSWGKFFASYIQKNNLFYIVPNEALSTNFSEEGEHNKIGNTTYQVALQQGINKIYKFLDFRYLYKYDMFFEPILEGKIGDIPTELIDMDLNKTKKKRLEKRYVLTTKKENFKIIKSYSLSLRPIELNILENLEGKGIYLYDKSIIVKNNNINKFTKLSYDIRGYNFLQLFPMGLKSLKEVLKIKIQIYLKKLRRR
jgi:hypothetical protein